MSTLEIFGTNFIYKGTKLNPILCCISLDMAASSDSDDESFVELGRALPFIESKRNIHYCHHFIRVIHFYVLTNTIGLVRLTA